jgi:hypothetical protein
VSDRKAVRESLYSYAKTGKPSSTNAINEYFGKPSGKGKADEDASVLMQLYNATNGGFGFADALDAYGKRARKLRTEAFDTLDSSVQPGIDPFVGAGRKALGTVQLLAHPFMALAPSPDEMQQRAIDAGNPEWAGVGWSLGNLVNLPSPSDSATVLAALGKGVTAAKGAASLVAPVAAMAPIVKKADEAEDVVQEVGEPIVRTMYQSKSLGRGSFESPPLTDKQIMSGARELVRDGMDMGGLKRMLEMDHPAARRSRPIYEKAMELLEKGVTLKPHKKPEYTPQQMPELSEEEKASIVRTLHQSKALGRRGNNE